MDEFVERVAKGLEKPKLDEGLAKAGDLLTGLVQDDAYVGDVYSLGYADALVQIHDHYRKRVGGARVLLPSRSGLHRDHQVLPPLK